MPIKINKAQGIQAARAAEIRKALNLPETTTVSPAATKTMIAYENGVTVILPHGVSSISGDAAKARYEEVGLAGITMHQPPTPHALSLDPNALSALPAAEPEDDEAWALAVAPTVLPETRPLAAATEMYQRVLPKGGDPYVVAFVGPNLIGVVRLRGKQIDLKFKGRFSSLPTGEVAEILKALNMSPSGTEYYSAHVIVPGGATNVTLVRAVLGGFYAALSEHLTSGFPDVERLVKA